MTLQGLMLRISPKNKLLLAAAAVCALALLAPGGNAALLARLALALCAVGGLVWWFRRARPRTSSGSGEFSLALAEPRLEVVSRAGLSQRCGVALVDAEGHRYLVVFGDGFAQLQEVRAAAPSAEVAS